MPGIYGFIACSIKLITINQLLNYKPDVHIRMSTRNAHGKRHMVYSERIFWIVAERPYVAYGKA